MEITNPLLAEQVNKLVEKSHLSEEQRKTVQKLENSIQLIRAAESNSVRDINQRLKQNTLKDYEAITEKGSVNGAATRAVSELSGQIRKILPDWRETLIGKVSNSLDATSKASVHASNKLGNVVGEVAHTPYQAAKGFFNSMKRKVNQRIR